MTGFEWQTDAEGDAQWLGNERLSSGRSLTRRWVWMLMVVAISLLALLFLRREAIRRVSLVEAEKETEIRAVHGLAADALNRNDGELLRGLLSGRDPQWVDAQMRRLDRGLLLSQASRPLGFEMISSPSVVEVSLDPAQQEAVLVEESRYQVTKTASLTRSVSLRQAHVYRRGEDRWYLSPPGSAFWGARRVIGGYRLRSAFWERDEAVVRRLHRDLQSKVDELCRLISRVGTCDGSAPIGVTFSRRTESVLDLADPSWRLDPEGEIVLPAPSLVGVPTDEAGYRALYRGYAGHFIAAVTTDLLGYRCCRRAAAYAAGLLKVQSELGVSTWPLNGAAKLRLLTDYATLHELKAAWNGPDPGAQSASDRLQLYALIDFFTEERNIPALDLVAGISGGTAIDDWFPEDAGNSEKAWRDYIFRTVNSAQEKVGRATESPGQDLLLACYSEGQSYLYRYRSGIDEVVKGIQGVEEAAPFYLLIPLSGDERVILAQSRSTPSAAPRLWQGREGVTLLQHPDSGQFFIPARPTFRRRALDPDGRFLPSWIFDYGTSRVRNVLLDLESCRDECTEWQELADGATFPNWAPDGGDLLWTQNRLVMRGHPGAARAVARGSTAFWLDHETYGYLSDGTVFLAKRTDDRPMALLTTEHLLAAIPEAGPGYGGSLNGIEAAPGGSGTLIFSVNGGISGDNYLILLDGHDTRRWQSGGPVVEDLSVLLQTGADIYPPPYSGFSPDGRWFAVRTRGNRRQDPELLVFDLKSLDPDPRLRLSATRFFESYDWSADGRWLARPMSNYVLLVAPEGPTLRYLFAPSGFDDWSECSSVAWIHPH